MSTSDEIYAMFEAEANAEMRRLGALTIGQLADEEKSDRRSRAERTLQRMEES